MFTVNLLQDLSTKTGFYWLLETSLINETIRTFCLLKKKTIDIYQGYFIGKEDPNDLRKHGLHAKQEIAEEQEKIKDAELKEISRDSFL